MSRGIIIRPEAEAELAEAYAWYGQQRPSLGDEFLLRLDACLSTIQSNPVLHPIVHRDIRRALLRRFPYGVFYVLGEDRITVLAILHLSRDPTRWMDRSP